MSQWRLSWPTAWGEPSGQAVIRTEPEDFVVQEILGWHLDGDGEHLCLWLEKRGDNSDFVAAELARLAGCRKMDVSFCGLKDRHAVTRQWFSLYRPRGEDAPLLAAVAERWQVLEHSRHRRKLRRGDHQGNRFSLRLRDCTAPREALTARWATLCEQGCPNYFGPQRFGFRGGNLDRALALKPQQLRGKAGFQSGMYLSAARSWCFNQWLASRVTAGNWQQMLPGDPGMAASVQATSQPVTAVATGPLAGDGSTGAAVPLLAQELEFLEQWPELTTLFRQTRMQPARRPLVLIPGEPALSWLGDDPRLEFTLPAGSFATAVLQELVTILDARHLPASQGDAL